MTPSSLYAFLSLGFLAVSQFCIADESATGQGASDQVSRVTQSEDLALDFSDCGNNPLARELAKLVIQDADQNRAVLVCNPLLADIAEEKAREMASSERVNHYGKSGANRRLINAGYKLAYIYPRLFENNVEAVSGGMDSPQGLWEKFKKSAVHRKHLLAEHEFYRLQNEIGAGYFKDPDTGHVEFWVIYIAHRNNNPEFTGEVAESKD